MHSWGFALREGLFAETKEGKCKNEITFQFIFLIFKLPVGCSEGWVVLQVNREVEE